MSHTKTVAVQAQIGGRVVFDETVPGKTHRLALMRRCMTSLDSIGGAGASGGRQRLAALHLCRRRHMRGAMRDNRMDLIADSLGRLDGRPRARRAGPPRPYTPLAFIC